MEGNQNDFLHQYHQACTDQGLGGVWNIFEARISVLENDNSALIQQNGTLSRQLALKGQQLASAAAEIRRLRNGESDHNTDIDESSPPVNNGDNGTATTVMITSANGAVGVDALPAAVIPAADITWLRDPESQYVSVPSDNLTPCEEWQHALNNMRQRLVLMHGEIGRLSKYERGYALAVKQARRLEATLAGNETMEPNIDAETRSQDQEIDPLDECLDDDVRELLLTLDGDDCEALRENNRKLAARLRATILENRMLSEQVRIVSPVVTEQPTGVPPGNSDPAEPGSSVEEVSSVSLEVSQSEDAPQPDPLDAGLSVSQLTSTGLTRSGSTTHGLGLGQRLDCLRKSLVSESSFIQTRVSASMSQQKQESTHTTSLSFSADRVLAPGRIISSVRHPIITPATKVFKYTPQQVVSFASGLQASLINAQAYT